MTSRRTWMTAATLLAWGAAAEAQTKPASAPASAPSPEGEETTELTVDPSSQRPLFGVATIGGAFGTDYIAGATLALFGTPHSSKVSLGGSAFFAPFAGVPSSCIEPCTTPSALLWRAMAELRLGTSYSDYRRSLGWFGVGAGLTYMSGLGLDPSPVVSVALGGDMRMTHSLWFELSPKLTWAQMIGPGSAYARAYVTGGFELGIRFDLAH
jgi:hypothetical protein